MDLGITDFAVTSDGTKIRNPRSLARRERSLARYQRRLARCQKGSANRAKARAKVARAHRKVRASRTDFLHRTSARLVRDHDVLVIEDLAVKNRNPRQSGRGVVNALKIELVRRREDAWKIALRSPVRARGVRSPQ